MILQQHSLQQNLLQDSTTSMHWHLLSLHKYTARTMSQHNNEIFRTNNKKKLRDFSNGITSPFNLFIPSWEGMVREKKKALATKWFTMHHHTTYIIYSTVPTLNEGRHLLPRTVGAAAQHTLTAPQPQTHWHNCHEKPKTSAHSKLKKGSRKLMFMEI